MGVVYALLAGLTLWNDLEYLSLIAPLGLLGIYFAIFYTEAIYLVIAFLTPLSINIEEYVDGFGLFLPTEPLLFGLMIYFLMIQLKKNQIHPKVWNNPIIWSAIFYLTWTLITCITSTAPVVSLKFLLVKLWFIVPMLFFGTKVFLNLKNLKIFLLLFCIAIAITICYTVTIHSTYAFGEKEGHWVMWPFFKDHTIYGAMVAFTIPILFSLYLSKKHSPIVKASFLLLIAITLIGLYFSYTRAAWLSIVAALCVLLVIKLKIKFSILFPIGLVAGLIIFFSWDSIQMELERNKFEHTTEEFGERLQSATNVTTDASNLERLNRWACAIEMFKERPVFGFGPGTYAFEYARFQEPENTTIISTNFGDMGNAHSEYLGPLSEMGFFGLLAMLGIVAAIFYKGITLYIKWDPQDKETRTLLLGMILALVTYFVHGFLNNYLDTDKASVPIWGICAAFVALEIYHEEKLKNLN